MTVSHQRPTARCFFQILAALSFARVVIGAKEGAWMGRVDPALAQMARRRQSVSRPPWAVSPAGCLPGRRGGASLVLSGAAPLAFASPLLDGCTTSGLLSSLASNNANDPLFVWGLRLTSALVGYVSGVAYLDRPRGALIHDADTLFEIKESTVPGAGLGLFVAVSSIPRNTVLGTYPGVLLPLQQNLPKLQEHPYCEAYIWRFSDSRYVLDPTDEHGILQPQCRGGSRYSWPLSIALCRGLTLPKPTMLCRVNEPPLGRDVNVVTTEDIDSRSVTFVMERDVYEGEELFMDYGLTYDRSQYSAVDGESNETSS